jgi:hypothetical protein
MAGVQDVIDLADYINDASPHHNRNAADRIIERYPLVLVLLEAIQNHVFKGASIHNRRFQALIKQFRGPSAMTDSELPRITN